MYVCAKKSNKEPFHIGSQSNVLQVAQSNRNLNECWKIFEFFSLFLNFNGVEETFKGKLNCNELKHSWEKSK